MRAKLPMKKPIALTAHARVRLQDRHIDTKWIEEAILDPDWTEVDPRDPAVERRFRAIPQFSGRVLRVACVETDSSIRVISAMFDRNARRKPWLT
jgi:uncharacterized DUF497 family protein